MLIKALSELIWRYSQSGVADATKQTLRKEDIMQQVRVTFGGFLRQTYHDSKRLNEGVADYSFTSPLLSIKRFKLTEATFQGMRRADMVDFDLYRLPKNEHFTNVYLVGDNCRQDVSGEITQVAPSEENFYIGKPDFTGYLFYVIKGRGMNTYNVPTCIHSVDIETTFDGDQIDISNDVAFDVANQILGTVMKLRGYYDEQKLKEEIKNEAELK